MNEWNEISTNLKGNISNVLYIREKYYAIVYNNTNNTSTIYYSDNLENWKEANITPNQINYNGRNYKFLDVEKIVYANGMFLGIVSYGAPTSQEGLYLTLPGYMYSTDGINWTAKAGQINGKSFYFDKLFVVNNTFCIQASVEKVANSDCFLSTKDGKNFKEHKMNGMDTHSFVESLCYFKNKYYAFNRYALGDFFQHTLIYSSTDLTNWKLEKKYDISIFLSAAVGKGRIISLMNDYTSNFYKQTKLVSTSDGSTWIEKTFTNNILDAPERITYLNGTFMMLRNNCVYISTTGDKWDKIAFDNFYIKEAIYNDNKLFLFGQDSQTQNVKISYKEISREVTYAADTALYVFDKNLNLLGVIDECISLTWIRKYYEAGEFNLVVAPYENNLKLLKNDNIIVRQNYTEAAIIDTVEIDDDGAQVEIHASGSFLSYLLHRRIVKNKVKFSGSVIDAQKELLANMTELAPNFEIESTKLNSENVDFQCTYKNVYDYMVKLSRYGNVGFRIVPNVETRGFIFENFIGLDRSHNQIENERYCFSKENSNINKNNIIKTTIGKCNFALVGGVGEDTNRKLVQVKNGNETGLDLFEEFVDAKSESNSNMTNSEYENILKQKGQEVLQDETITIEFTGESSDYKTKWDLGDLVDLEISDYGISEINRITEIEEVTERNNYSVRPTFGPAFADKLNLEE